MRKLNRMPTGTVKLLLDKQGYGFIVGEDGRDVFFAHKAVPSHGFRKLAVGQTVEYELVSETHGFFQLRSCGALLDVEPFGERSIKGMCHTIEDGTFDITAQAVNPKARIRPVQLAAKCRAARAVRSARGTSMANACRDASREHARPRAGSLVTGGKFWRGTDWRCGRRA